MTWSVWLNNCHTLFYHQILRFSSVRSFTHSPCTHRGVQGSGICLHACLLIFHLLTPYWCLQVPQTTWSSPEHLTQEISPSTPKLSKLHFTSPISLFFTLSPAALCPAHPFSLLSAVSNPALPDRLSLFPRAQEFSLYHSLMCIICIAKASSSHLRMCSVMPDTLWPHEL